jgi:predicted DsbA family dithiol-disulfide isomerase
LNRALKLPATLFADFTCPASYLLEAALWRRSTEELEIGFRALELFPAPYDIPADRFTSAAWDELRSIARQLELGLNKPGFGPRTRKAHEAARWARDMGIEREMRTAIYEAYWHTGLDIERIDALIDIAAGIGAEASELKIALDIDQYEADILADNDLARRLRIPGTPLLFLGTGPNATVLAGALAPGELEEAIRAVVAETGRREHG